MDAHLSYHIRDYSEEDYSGILELWKVTGLAPAIRADDNDVILRTIKAGGRLRIITIESSDTIIGSSWLSTDGRRTYIHHFGIHPDFQGKGLGDIMTEDSLRCAKEIGLQVKLEVHESNLAAIHLYKKHQFKYLGDYDVYIIRDINNIV